MSAGHVTSALPRLPSRQGRQKLALTRHLGLSHSCLGVTTQG
jgi:hypothetical protein